MHESCPHGRFSLIAIKLKYRGPAGRNGARLISRLAKPLTAGFGRGFDASDLRHIQLSYLAFPIRDAPRHELGWTRYRMVDGLKHAPDDTFTAGITLCAGKDAAAVRNSVPHENEQFFAGKYKLILPPEDELKAEREKKQPWLAEQKEAKGKDVL